ncbi:hypothetical protein HAX54_008996, partial [Datura stramonium]|nr:hypothetical protein [Datura stramonium]
MGSGVNEWLPRVIELGTTQPARYQVVNALWHQVWGLVFRCKNEGARTVGASYGVALMLVVIGKSSFFEKFIK